jgi:glutamate racemase
VQIIEQIGYDLVPMIENGEIESTRMKELLKSYLQPMVNKNIDFLVLGCTHYPYLIPIIQQILPTKIQVIDSGEAVAKQTKRILEINNILNTSTKLPKVKFYSNSNDISVLKKLIGSQFEVSFLDF